MHIVEKTKLEKAIEYKDKYPCLKFRKSLMIVLIRFQLLCSAIISNTIFEYLTIMVIIANSIALALDDPLKTYTSTY